MTMKEEAARACEALRKDDTGTDEVLGYNRAVRDCAAAVRQCGNTSEENGAGDLTDERIIAIAAENDIKVRTGQGAIKFARAIERAAIASYLARQPKAEQPVIKTWQERATFLPPLHKPSTPVEEAMAAEIADLRTHLARQAQAEPVGKGTEE